MDNSKAVNLRRRRDFGGVFNTLFEFMRQNFRLLGKCVLFVTGPVMLINAIISGYFQPSLFAIIRDPYSITRNNSIFVWIAVAALVSSLGFAVLVSVVNAYVLLYQERGADQFEVEEVWAEVRHDLLMIIFTSIGLAIIIIFGLLFLILPGIYLWVALSSVVTIRVVERLSFGSAISRSFELIRGEWWPTFGLFLLTFIVGYIINYAFSIPQSIVVTLVMFNGVGEGSMVMRLVTIITSLISSIGAYVLYTMMFLMAILQYYNLVELKEGVGVMTMIDQIGESNDTEERAGASF